MSEISFASRIHNRLAGSVKANSRSDCVAIAAEADAEIARLRAFAADLHTALTELRDRIKGHPAYADLTEEEEMECGGDTAEFSYLARVADAALGHNVSYQSKVTHNK